MRRSLFLAFAIALWVFSSPSMAQMNTEGDPKPSLDAVMSQAQLENKVAEYLRNSQALEDYWQRPITADQLQAEMERMASYTKQPEVLRELFEALGNDPFVIAECLARPVLTERLIADASAQHQTGRLESLRTAEMQMPKKVAAIDSIAIVFRLCWPEYTPKNSVFEHDHEQEHE